MIITIPASKKVKWLELWRIAHSSGDPIAGERLVSMLLGAGVKFKARKVLIHNKLDKEDVRIEVTKGKGYG